MHRRILLTSLVVGTLLTACQFEEGGLPWGPDALSPDDRGPADDVDQPGLPDAAPTAPDAAPPPADAAPLCADPLVECPEDGCVDLDDDRDNCGECGKHCKGDQDCRNGQCEEND